MREMGVIVFMVESQILIRKRGANHLGIGWENYQRFFLKLLNFCCLFFGGIFVTKIKPKYN
jgi:hypothetical protein